jgi:hypothetical protein
MEPPRRAVPPPSTPAARSSQRNPNGNLTLCEPLLLFFKLMLG